MIDLYSGTPGSGKSLNTARLIRDKLQMKKGSVIIGNFYVNTAMIKKRKGYYLMIDNSRLTPERLIKFAIRYSQHIGRRLKEGELLLIIDEAQLLFNSRDWQSNQRAAWLSFFSQHRHLGYDVILIAQFDRMLDRQVRSLIENQFIHRKVSRAGKFGKVLSFFTGGNLFIVIKQWYPMKTKVDSEFFLGGKRLYSIYDSYNYFQSFSKV